MKDTVRETVWYGEIRSEKGNMVVIRDEDLPKADAGRIYLYNTERDAIIQYDEAIVTPKLFPLDDEQRQQAEKQFQSAWQRAYKQFMRSHRKFSDSASQNVDSELENDEFQDDEDG